MYAGPHRSVFGNPVARSLEVVGPLDLMQSGEVHTDLPDDPEDIEQTDIGFDERHNFLLVEVVWLKHSKPVGEVCLLQLAVAVQLVEELLDVVQAHRTSA